jgi:hypothetical protein
MTTPKLDLAAIRLEAPHFGSRAAQDQIEILCDEVERLTADLAHAHQRDSMKTREVNIMVEENRTLASNVERLRALIETAKSQLVAANKCVFFDSIFIHMELARQALES